MAYKARRTRDLQGEVTAGSGMLVTETIKADGTRNYSISVDADSIPQQDSTDPVESGGVYEELQKKEDKAIEVSVSDGDSVMLEDNHIYAGSENIATLTLTAPATGTSVISFNTPASGPITVTTIGIAFANTPIFNNNEHWEIAVRNGYAVFTKYDLV